MNKVVEYMTLGIPVVGFDLVETRRTAGEAALYALDNSPDDLAAKIAMVCDDAALKQQLIDDGKARASAVLRWDRDSAELLRAYATALAPRSALNPAAAR